jgi:MscS family membrane protein
MDLKELINQINMFGDDYAWVMQVFVVIFSSMVFNFFQKRALNRIHKKLETTKNPWDDLLIGSLRKPITLLIWLLGLTFAAEIVQQESGAAIFEAIGPLRDIGVIVILIIFLLQIIKGAEANFITRESETGERDFDKHTVEAIAKLFRVSVIITATLVVLQTMGYSVSGVLAFGGVGGVAVGFAAKDMLSNFFGGLIIYLDRPFKVGDWIRSDDRQIEGTVESIGWRVTRIRTFDKRPLYVPNSVFTSVAVENPSRMTNRRIYETIGIRYDDASKMASIVEQVKDMLSNHPEIDTRQTLIVNFNSFAASSIDFFVYTFTKTTDWVKFHGIKQDVLLKILEIIEKEGAETAFPTSTLHVQSMPAELEMKHGR